jgi:hypothetical protein
VETVEYKNISFTVWDVGGQDKVHAFVYVSVKRLCTVICGKFGNLCVCMCAFDILSCTSCFLFFMDRNNGFVLQ